MKDFSLNKKITVEFRKFIIVGIFSTVSNYAIFYIFISTLSLNYLVSSSIGYLAGVLIGYNLNRKWTFEVTSKRKMYEVINYNAVYLTSLILSLFFLKIVVGIFGINPKIANMFAIVITTCTNFLGIKFIVFKKK